MLQRIVSSLASIFRFGAATPNNPSFNLHSVEDWENYWAGPPSASGLRINSDTALTYSPWWRGMNLISRDVARLPLHNYLRKSDGGRERNTAHPAYKVMRRKANQYQTAFQFKLTLTGHALSYGNGYGYIYRDGDGSVTDPDDGGGIIPLDPSCTVPIKETVGGTTRLWYVTKVDGEDRKLTADNVLHVKGLGFDGMVGYDVIRLARDAIGLGKAQEKFRSTFFSNGAHLKVVLETPGTINPKQAKEIIDSWNRMQGGLDKAHMTAILHSGLKANQLASTLRESQTAEGVELSIRDAANILGIPPHKLGAKTGESYASKEQENLDYLLQALDFWLVAWEDECHDKLLTEDEKNDESAYFEFAREKLFETDLKTKAEYFRIALAGHPWHAPNEARLAFNLPPIEGYDNLVAPGNMGSTAAPPDEEAPDEPVEEEETEEDDEEEQPGEEDVRLKAALTAQLRERVGYVVRRIGQHAERAAKDADKFMAWLDGFPGDQAAVVAEAVGHAEAACNAFTGRDDTPECAGWIIATVRNDLLEWSGTVTPANLAEKLPEQIKRLDAHLQALAENNLMGTQS